MTLLPYITNLREGDKGGEDDREKVALSKKNATFFSDAPTNFHTPFWNYGDDRARTGNPDVANVVLSH